MIPRISSGGVIHIIVVHVHYLYEYINLRFGVCVCVCIKWLLGLNFEGLLYYLYFIVIALLDRGGDKSFNVLCKIEKECKCKCELVTKKILLGVIHIIFVRDHLAL